MTTIETIATVLGVVNVALIILRNIWNYPFGLAMVSLYAWIFFTAKLYADASLQIFYLAVQLYGWVNWHQSQKASGELSVLVMPGRRRFALVVAAIASSLVAGFALARWTDAAAPWWDSAVGVLSVFAQTLLSLRYVESWALWILVDLISIVLFWSKGLEITSALYALFLVMAVLGLVEWARHLRERAQPIGTIDASVA